MKRDETRVTSETGGQKASKQAQLGALDPLPLIALAEVAGFGAEKYDTHNFLKGYDWSLSFNAAMRHALLAWSGEDDDPESGLPHLAHAMWNLHTLLAFQLRGIGTDDRPSEANLAPLRAGADKLVAGLVAAVQEEGSPAEVEQTDLQLRSLQGRAPARQELQVLQPYFDAMQAALEETWGRVFQEIDDALTDALTEEDGGIWALDAEGGHALPDGTVLGHDAMVVNSGTFLDATVDSAWTTVVDGADSATGASLYDGNFADGRKVLNPEILGEFRPVELEEPETWAIPSPVYMNDFPLFDSATEDGFAGADLLSTSPHSAESKEGFLLLTPEKVANLGPWHKAGRDLQPGHRVMLVSDVPTYTSSRGDVTSSAADDGVTRGYLGTLGQDCGDGDWDVNWDGLSAAYVIKGSQVAVVVTK